MVRKCKRELGPRHGSWEEEGAAGQALGALGRAFSSISLPNGYLQKQPSENLQFFIFSNSFNSFNRIPIEKIKKTEGFL